MRGKSDSDALSSLRQTPLCLKKQKIAAHQALLRTETGNVSFNVSNISNSFVISNWVLEKEADIQSRYLHPAI